MTSANPAMDADFSASEGQHSHGGRGKHLLKLMVMVTAVGFVFKKIRGGSTPDMEADDGD